MFLQKAVQSFGVCFPAKICDHRPTRPSLSTRDCPQRVGPGCPGAENVFCLPSFPMSPMCISCIAGGWAGHIHVRLHNCQYGLLEKSKVFVHNSWLFWPHVIFCSEHFAGCGSRLTWWGGHKTILSLFSVFLTFVGYFSRCFYRINIIDVQAQQWPSLHNKVTLTRFCTFCLLSLLGMPRQGADVPPTAGGWRLVSRHDGTGTRGN